MLGGFLGSESRQRLRALESEAVLLRAESASLRQEIDTLKAQADSFNQHFQSLWRVLSDEGDIVRSIHELREALAAQREELRTLRAELAEARAEVERGQDAAQQAVQRLEAELERMQRAANVWQRELMLLAGRLRAASQLAPARPAAAEPPAQELPLAVHALAAIHEADEQAAARAQRLLEHLRGCARVVALGAGFGDFLRAASGTLAVQAVEPDPALAQYCREQGFAVANADPVQFLRTLGDESVDGVVSSHLPEQLSDAALFDLLRESHRVVREGGHLVLELYQPASLAALREMLSLGGLPKRLLHPDRTRALLLAAGFHAVEIDLGAPRPGAPEAATYVSSARRTRRSLLAAPGASQPAPQGG